MYMCCVMYIISESMCYVMYIVDESMYCVCGEG